MSYIVRLSLSESLTVLDNILIYIFFGFSHISPNVNDRQSNYMGLLALIPPPHNNNFISVLEALADCPWRKLANWGTLQADLDFDLAKQWKTNRYPKDRTHSFSLAF